MFIEENTGIESDESHLEPSSEAHTSQESNETAPQPQAAEAVETKQPEPTVPFNEHPRFRELVEQKNAFANELKTMREQMSRFEQERSKVSEAQKKEDALISRLKGIDPEFGGRFEQVDSGLRELAELKQWKQEQELQALRTQAFNTVKDLHTKHGVSEDMQALYNAQLELMGNANPNLRVQDIPGLYSQVHGQLSKMIEGIKRAERESYLKAKKSDASVPTSQPRGKPASPTQKSPQFSADPEKARQELVSRIVAKSRASGTDSL